MKDANFVDVSADSCDVVSEAMWVVVSAASCVSPSAAKFVVVSAFTPIAEIDGRTYDPDSPVAREIAAVYARTVRGESAWSSAWLTEV